MSETSSLRRRASSAEDGEPPDRRQAERHRLTVIGGLAALSLDAMASVAYGPEAIVIVLALAGASLIVDYVLNVAVSVAAGVAALTSAFPELHRYTVWLCLGVLALITAIKLLG